MTKLVVDVIGYDFLFFNRFASDEINNKTARDHGTYSNRRAKTFRFTLDVHVQAAREHLAVRDAASHVRHLFGPFIDQQDDQVTFRVIGLD